MVNPENEFTEIRMAVLFLVVTETVYSNELEIELAI